MENSTNLVRILADLHVIIKVPLTSPGRKFTELSIELAVEVLAFSTILMLADIRFIYMLSAEFRNYVGLYKFVIMLSIANQ